MLVRFLRRSRVVLLATVLVAGVFAAPGPAIADTQTTTSSTIYQGYSRTVMTRFYSPNMCVQTQFGGVVSFRRNIETWHRTTSNDTIYLYYIDHFALTNNTLTIKTFKPSGSTCTSTRMRYVTMKAKLKAGNYSCDMHPSFSLQYPWGVGFSFWPSCGRTELAGWSEFDADGGSYFKLSHSNDKVGGYGEESKNWSPTRLSGLKWACAALAADLTPKTGTAVDTKTTVKIKACPVWDGSTGGW